ncbi:DUF441 domain-containing protein [Natronincola ferrireducens]|uniref:UPF0756 membrane protein SAMN05660472_02961 n=1 Tax=Natronincola ferrireducens TaxID=393762 RepID=A0A1G9IWZ5_9FIRM|nr:DUF441 domain-containing protein [Natronincola ferrireducens]SDL29747.1 Uncharacterized membrane protein, DUF441 family [Natronincola ferrireducens]
MNSYAFLGEIILVSILFISILTHNNIIAISSCALLLLKILKQNQVLTLIEKQGINWGVIFLTAGFLAPFALGRYSLEDIKSVLLRTDGIIGILAGASVAILGAKGVSLGTTNPSALLGVIVGTFVGVTFFKGVPVGPMIGTGIALIMINALSFFSNVK